MIAYNREWLDALLTRETASQWHKKGLLSEEKWQAIEAHYPSNFYSPNVFVRIGLALFSLILLIAAMGLTGILGDLGSEASLSIFCFFWGLICFGVLEFRIIRAGRHLGSGIDDMLLYFGVGCFITCFCVSLDYTTPTLVYQMIAWPFLVLGAVRYLDRLAAAAAFGCSLLIVLLVVKDIPKLALLLLPFSGMAFSAGAYFFARAGQKRYEWRHWQGVLTIVEMLALLTFYASGNYWVVQQAGFELYQLEQAPMAWFFWVFTFLVPLVYIFQGLRAKDRHLLDVGLGCIGVAVFTFRYYFHIMPLTWAAVIGGAVFFAVAYFSIRYLRQHEGAFTYEEDAETSLLQEIEQQLIEQTIANQPGPKPEKQDGFGGGQFGGGGASGEF